MKFVAAIALSFYALLLYSAAHAEAPANNATTPAAKPPSLIERCWASTETVCWPLGSQPQPWQRAYLNDPGTALLCKNDVCEPVYWMEI